MLEYPASPSVALRQVSATLDAGRTIGSRLPADPETLSLLSQHLTVLESKGITDLAALSNLTLAGNVLPQPGLTSPLLGNIYGPATAFQGAYKRAAEGENVLKPYGGHARALRADPISQPPTLPI